MCNSRVVVTFSRQWRPGYGTQLFIKGTRYLSNGLCTSNHEQYNDGMPTMAYDVLEMFSNVKDLVFNQFLKSLVKFSQKVCIVSPWVKYGFPMPCTHKTCIYTHLMHLST